MSAILPPNGAPPRKLDRDAEPERQLTPEQWRDAPMMTRILMSLLRDVSRLKRRFWPAHIEHEDVVFDGTGTVAFRLPHGMNGRVRWWVTDWTGATGGPQLVRHDATDYNTLVLVSYAAGVGTIRIQASG